MKIFDFLVKMAIFRAFLLFSGDLRHALRPQSNTWSGQNAWQESPKKRRNALKMVILTKKSKNFIKAKLTVSKSYLLGLVYLMIFLHFKGCPYINHKISLRFEPYHDHFFDFSQSFYDASSYGSTFKKVIFNDGFNLN